MAQSYRIVGDSAYLTLSRGQETVIDAVDLPRALEYKWYATPHTMGGYYAMTSTNGTTIYLHRYLLDAPKGSSVDHWNHDTLDNRRSNIRLTTTAINAANRDGAYKTSKLGIRGVSAHRTNDGHFLYVFRCHIVTCKLAKYFPYTDEGLEAAKLLSESHYSKVAA